MNEAQKALAEEAKLLKVSDVADFTRQEVSILEDAMQKAADARAKLSGVGGVVDASAKHYTQAAGGYTQENLALMKELEATCIEIHDQAKKKACPEKKNETLSTIPQNTQFSNQSRVNNTFVSENSPNLSVAAGRGGLEKKSDKTFSVEDKNHKRI